VTELGLATFETELGGALELGERALLWAEASGRPLLASASFSAQALVLGALQRADTLRARSPARFDVPLARRRTTGTEAQLDGAVLYHALALPRVDALFADASARTLLNRNLRAILRGYAAIGAPLRYFGTEVLALLGHPVALVGYDQLASGATLIEVLIGLENPCVVRPALKREPPAALFSLWRNAAAPHDLLVRAVNGIVERLAATAVDVASLLPTLETPCRVDFPESTPAWVAIPLGVVEAVVVPAPRISGDLLVSRAALARFEERAGQLLEQPALPTSDLLALFDGAPLDGAKPTDLLRALTLASAPSA
jgi:hypothetical protein